MILHEFGDKSNPIVILIHGVLTPWQMWEKQIEYFSDRYFVIVPALDAHVEEEPSEYISADEEAEKISEYVLNNYGKDVFLLSGLSMGGVVANKIFETGKLLVHHLVFDGAPLVSAPKFMVSIMTKNYISIIHGSKKREKKVLDNFVKYFLPEKYLRSFLKFADTMSDESVKNIVKSACRCRMLKAVNTDTKILFLHGTKANELFAKKAAKKIARIYTDATVEVFKGYAHGELAIYHPEEWCAIVDCFTSQRRWDNEE